MTKEKFFSIISEISKVEFSEITDDSNLYEELGLDSLELSKIVAEVESIYDTVYREELYAGVATVGELYSVLTTMR